MSSTVKNHLVNRQQGLHGAQEKLQQFVTEQTVNNIINNVCALYLIKLTPNTIHRVKRCQDYAAVFSNPSRVDQNMMRIALWHLPSASRVWETDLVKPNDNSSISYCSVTRSGLVLAHTSFDDTLIARTFVVYNGQVSFDKRAWTSCEGEGNRILSTWKESRKGTNRSYMGSCMGEWNATGKRLYKLSLSQHKDRRKSIIVCDQNYWVRLAASSNPATPSLIEVVHRDSQILNPFKMPLAMDAIEFVTPCIVNDQLFFGEKKTKDTVLVGSVICQIDLTYGHPIRAFRIQHPAFDNPIIYTPPKGLVVTSHFAAWFVQDGDGRDSLVYLNISNHTLHQPESMQFFDFGETALSICGSLLTVIYPLVINPHDNQFISIWQRKTFDMAKNTLIRSEQYFKEAYGTCSIFNGIGFLKSFHEDSEVMAIFNYENDTKNLMQT